MVQYSLSLNLQDNTLSIKSVIEFTKKKIIFQENTRQLVKILKISLFYYIF